MSGTAVIKLVALVAVVAYAAPSFAEPEMHAPTAKLEDVVNSLVLDHCLPETLGEGAKPPANGLRGKRRAPAALQHDLSPSALIVPSASGTVFYDHYEGYCRVVALSADGRAITDQLIQHFGVKDRSHSTWRYPSRHRTLVEHTSFEIESQRRGHCVPIIVIDLVRTGERWIDIDVGWGSDSDQQAPELCRRR